VVTTNETHSLPQELPVDVSTQVPVSEAGGSPSAVRAHEVALTEAWANLDESVKALRGYEKTLVANFKTAERRYHEQRADTRLRLKKDLAEQRKVERLLAAHKRIQTPRRKS